jgi:hypothetical protein
MVKVLLSFKNVRLYDVYSTFKIDRFNNFDISKRWIIQFECEPYFARFSENVFVKVTHNGPFGPLKVKTTRMWVFNMDVCEGHSHGTHKHVMGITYTWAKPMIKSEVSLTRANLGLGYIP